MKDHLAFIMLEIFGVLLMVIHSTFRRIQQKYADQGIAGTIPSVLDTTSNKGGK